jgi:hypothetical protein
MLEVLRKVCGESRSVECATLAEARGDNALAIRYLVGLRMRPRPAVPFPRLEERLALQLTLELTGGRQVEVTELDSEVAAATSDGAPNPYVVFCAPSI